MIASKARASASWWVVGCASIVGILIVCVAWRSFLSLAVAPSPKRSPHVEYSSTTANRRDAKSAGSPLRLPEFLTQQVTGVPDRMWSVGELSAWLRKQGYRICCEELPRRVDQRASKFQFGGRALALHQLLDEMVLADPNYRWEWMHRSGIVNVVPMSSSRLDRVAPSQDYQNRKLMVCVNQLVQPCRLSYGIFHLGNREDPGRMDWWPVSLRASGLSTRDCLNLLAAQYEGMTWNVTPGPAVLFEVHPQANFDQIAERLRSEARQQDATSP